ERRGQAEQHMISPSAVNFQISLSESFLLEAGFREQASGGLVVWDAGGFQAMEAEAAEGEVADRADRRQRMALARIGLAAPVADRAHLGDAPANVGKRDPAGQRAVAVAEHEERIGRAGVAVAGIGYEAAAIGRAAQVVRRPGG